MWGFESPLGRYIPNELIMPSMDYLEGYLAFNAFREDSSGDASVFDLEVYVINLEDEV